MSRITLAELAAPEVELPGSHVYTVAPATRAVITKAKEIDARLEALADDDIDGVVNVYCEIATLRLTSVKAGQPRAGTVLKKLWDGDKVTLPQIEQLLASVNQTDRPT